MPRCRASCWTLHWWRQDVSARELMQEFGVYERVLRGGARGKRVNAQWLHEERYDDDEGDASWPCRWLGKPGATASQERPACPA